MLRKFLNNNFGFSGLETLKSQNTGEEVKLVDLIKSIEEKGNALKIIDNIKIYFRDDKKAVQKYLTNIMESTPKHYEVYRLHYDGLQYSYKKIISG